jgi:hypothetical protein
VFNLYCTLNCAAARLEAIIPARGRGMAAESRIYSMQQHFLALHHVDNWAVRPITETCLDSGILAGYLNTSGKLAISVI